MINRELALAEQLARRGAEVTVLSVFRPTRPAPSGVAVARVWPTRYMDLLLGPLFAPLMALRLWWLLRRARPQIVLTDLPGEARWALRLRPFVTRYRVVFTYHGTADPALFDADAARGLERVRAQSHAVMRRVDQVVVVSDHLLDEARAAGADPLRVHNGVDLARFSPERRFGRIAATGPTALFVGRYYAAKGVHELLQAFAIVRQSVPEAELILRGFREDPSYWEAMMALLREHELQGAVHCLGPIDAEEMPYLLNLARVFVSSSRSESFGMPLLEAQACGVPCVAFRVGGVPEVVRDGVTGLLADDADVDGLAAHLISLLSDDALRAAMAAAARPHAERFAYDRLADQLEPALARLLEAA